MTKSVARAALAGVFVLGMVSAPAAFAEEGKTSSGGTSSNAGNSGDKSDKKTQENENSADKSKQQR